MGEGANGQGVGAQEHLAIAIAHHQGAATPGAQDEVRLAVNKGAQGIGAREPVQGRFESRQRCETRFQPPVNQMGDDFRVGVALENPAGGGEFGLQGREILDDSVMDQHDPPRLLGMGVSNRGCAVGGPARVAKAHRPLQGLGLQQGLKLPDPSRGATPLQAVRREGRDTR